MIKYKKLLYRLIIPNVTGAASFLLYYFIKFRELSREKILYVIALTCLGFAFLTILEYVLISFDIKDGEKKESDYMLRWEKREQNKELSQEEHSEDSDTPES